MPGRKPTVAIVDAFSSANQYAKECHKRGYQCIHVQSTRQIPDFYKHSFRGEDFEKSIIHEGQLGETLEELKKLHLKSLFVGAESGVMFADQLSEKLEMRTNGTRMSLARRNKYEMTRAIVRNGLRGAKQIQSNKLDEILSWIDHNLSYPVVIKPLNSAGTDGVNICNNEGDVKNAFQSMIGKFNQYKLFNDQLLVQEFLRGTEYVVNTVSLDGKRYINQIWQYHKIIIEKRYRIYDFSELLVERDSKVQKLIEYNNAVLTALEINNGPTHAEIMMSPEGECVLVEVAARLDGMAYPSVERKYIEKCQIDLTLDVYLDPDKLEEPKPYPQGIKKRARLVTLINHNDTKVSTFEKLDRIQDFPSYGGMKLFVKLEDDLPKTIDLYTTPGIIFLIHEDIEVIEKDYQTIRSMEIVGLF